MSKGLLKIFAVIAFCSMVRADFDISQITSNGIAEQFPNVNETMKHIKTLARDKCISVAGEENGEQMYAEIEMGLFPFINCSSTILNITAIKDEIDAAAKDGNLDLVFNKHCGKRPDALKCIEDFNAKFVPCLDAEERETQAVIMRIVRSLLNFICHKDGDQIALFIAEKGPECLESKKDDIAQCVNATFSHYAPTEGIENIKTLPKFVINSEQCEDIEKLEKCIVEHLETCSEITPANIIESMFRFIKNETVCRNMPSSNKRQSGAQSSISGSLNTLISLISLFMIFALAKIMQ